MAESDKSMHAQVYGNDADVNFKVMPDKAQYDIEQNSGMINRNPSTGAEQPSLPA